MSKRALVVLTDGFEDIEAIAPIDVLTRAGVVVTVAGLRPGAVKAAYGTSILPNAQIDDVRGQSFDAVIFPGGRVNAQGLASDQRVVELVRAQHKADRLVAAICAAPSHLLGEAAGILQGRRATGDPFFNDRLAAAGAIVTNEQVTVDANIVTGMGPGAAMLFALQLTEELIGRETADTYAMKWRIDRRGK
jgi:4-methyl-5(b-hydroxyethyl)-thiazole monophosphate biosynthesis